METIARHGLAIMVMLVIVGGIGVALDRALLRRGTSLARRRIASSYVLPYSALLGAALGVSVDSGPSDSWPGLLYALFFFVVAAVVLQAIGRVELARDARLLRHEGLLPRRRIKLLTVDVVGCGLTAVLTVIVAVLTTALVHAYDPAALATPVQSPQATAPTISELLSNPIIVACVVPMALGLSLTASIHYRLKRQRSSQDRYHDQRLAAAASFGDYGASL